MGSMLPALALKKLDLLHKPTEMVYCNWTRLIYQADIGRESKERLKSNA